MVADASSMVSECRACASKLSPLAESFCSVALRNHRGQSSVSGKRCATPASTAPPPDPLLARWEEMRKDLTPQQQEPMDKLLTEMVGLRSVKEYALNIYGYVLGNDKLDVSVAGACVWARARARARQHAQG